MGSIESKRIELDQIGLIGLNQSRIETVCRCMGSIESERIQLDWIKSKDRIGLIRSNQSRIKTVCRRMGSDRIGLDQIKVLSKWCVCVCVCVCVN